MGVHLQNRVLGNSNELGSAKATAETILLTGIGPMGDRKVSHWSKSAKGTLPCRSITSKWQQTHDVSGNTISKSWSGSVITSWHFGSKLDVMMGHNMKNIKLHEVGVAAHLSKRGGGSWSGVGGRWCTSKESKLLEVGI